MVALSSSLTLLLFAISGKACAEGESAAVGDVRDGRVLQTLEECEERDENCKYCAGVDPPDCQEGGCKWLHTNNDTNLECQSCGPCANLTDGVLNGNLTVFEGCRSCRGCEWDDVNEQCFDCNAEFGSEYVCDGCARDSRFRCTTCSSGDPNNDKGTNLKGQCKDCKIEVAQRTCSGPTCKGQPKYDCDFGTKQPLYVADKLRPGCCQVNCTTYGEDSCKEGPDKRWCRWIVSGPFSDGGTGQCNRKCNNDENVEIPPGCKAAWCIAVDDEGGFSCEKCKTNYTRVRIDGGQGRCLPDAPLPDCGSLNRSNCKAEARCQWISPNRGGPLAGSCAPKCGDYNVTTPIGCKSAWCVVDIKKGDKVSCEKCKSGFRLNRFDEYGKCQKEFR